MAESPIQGGSGFGLRSSANTGLAAMGVMHAKTVKMAFGIYVGGMQLVTYCRADFAAPILQRPSYIHSYVGIVSFV